ncbi:cytochrome P450 [Decorospora gaudefroyi]|uniref:Cytochrome P450 n=1 Tax=Decorospora gaudefroyi TaxID=184978 RepID=A0A6A5KZ71_9PLEO|nr:cytochrome P450 [Decorospora gaudefroyi]
MTGRKDVHHDFAVAISWSRLKEAIYEPFLNQSIPYDASPFASSAQETKSGLWTGTSRQVLVAAGILAIPFVFNYLFAVIVYHWTNLRRTKRQTPPEYPAMLPFVGSTFSFLWDSASFVKKATSYAGKLTCVRISLLVNGIFLVQEPAAVADMWKNQCLSSPIYVYTIGLRYMFGMSEKALETYTADDSGPARNPHPSSNVAPHNRVDFLTHDLLLRGLTGAPMLPTFRRFQTIVKRNLGAQEIGDEWVEMPDLFRFFTKNIGTAVLEALFGPSLLEINPGFADDMWTFDQEVQNLAKRLPRFMIPRAYQVRNRMLAQIQNWYRYAREHFRDDEDGAAGDWDPFWGSVMNRDRQKSLLGIDGQDDAAMASADLGLMWTSITNSVPSTMMTALHIFKDADLLSRIRASLEDTVSRDASGVELAMDKLLSKDLLQSVYAEVLRLYVQTYITRCAPHEDVAIGSWWLPRNEVGMVSSHVSHMNTEFWNEQNGKHPVTSFWAERFLLDPSDAQSGPMKRTAGDMTNEAEDKAAKGATDGGQFSSKGLSGAWIPYGGGFGACPGRLLAKRMIMFTSALLVSEFDIEIRTPEFEMDSSHYGLGIQKPKVPVAFAIRRRKACH